jgi:hypothetical protein
LNLLPDERQIAQCCHYFDRIVSIFLPLFLGRRVLLKITIQKVAGEKGYGGVLGVILNYRASVLVIVSQCLLVEANQVTTHRIRPNFAHSRSNLASEQANKLRKICLVINDMKEGRKTT